jgi:hypothetical protein
LDALLAEQTVAMNKLDCEYDGYLCLSGRGDRRIQILNWRFVLLAKPTAEEDEIKAE